MSEFTKGKWEIEGTVPFGIKSEASLRIAIVLDSVVKVYLTT